VSRRGYPHGESDDGGHVCDGATIENQRAEFLATQMKALTEDLSLKNAATGTLDEVRLMELT